MSDAQQLAAEVLVRELGYWEDHDNWPHYSTTSHPKYLAAALAAAGLLVDDDTARLVNRARLVAAAKLEPDAPDTLLGYPVTVELIVRYLRGEDIDPNW